MGGSGFLQRTLSPCVPHFAQRPFRVLMTKIEDKHGAGAAMQRRTFVTLLGGAATWPIAARAQERVRRIGVLTNFASDDAEGQARLTAFREALRQLGWTEGGNVRID